MFKDSMYVPNYKTVQKLVTMFNDSVYVSNYKTVPTLVQKEINICWESVTKEGMWKEIYNVTKTQRGWGSKWNYII